MIAEGAEASHQRFAHVVEALVDVLEAFRRDSFDTDECPLDVGPPHRLQELNVFRGLHGDLCEEHHVRRQLRQPLHQLESLRAQRPKLLQPRDIVLALRHRDVSQGYRVEVVIGERHETEAAASKIENLLDDNIHATLSRRSGHRYARQSRTSSASDSRARFGPSPTCSGPSAAVPNAQGRSGRHRPGRPRRPAAACRATHRRARAARQRRRPLDDGMCAAQIERLVGVERGVDAAENHDRPRALARVPISYPRSALPV